MTRVLLGLLLSLFAAIALAGSPSVASDDAGSGSCPKAAKPASPPTADADGTTDKNPDPSTSTHHLRGGGGHAVTPRWHSMLPGMFR